jgi:hypothetical protein
MDKQGCISLQGSIIEKRRRKEILNLENLLDERCPQ